MVFAHWSDALLFAVNSACFLAAFPLYCYFRGFDRSGMCLMGGIITLCAFSNSILLAVGLL